MTHIIEELRREHRDHALLLNILEHRVGQMEYGLEADFDLVNEVMDYFVTTRISSTIPRKSWFWNIWSSATRAQRPCCAPCVWTTLNPKPR